MSILDSRGSNQPRGEGHQTTLSSSSRPRIGSGGALESGDRHGRGAPDRVRELALVASRAAISVDWDGGASEMEVRRAVRAVCQVARAGGLQIEHLLIVMKEAWHELPGNRRRVDPATQATLARIVTICIHEYYRPSEQ